MSEAPSACHCLYNCRVYHRRLYPKQHELRHRVFLFGVDLDHLESLRLPSRLLGAEEAALYSLRAKDHLGKTSAVSLRPRIDAWLAERNIARPARVFFVTNLRFFGYVFNPIAVYFCFDEKGAPLAAVAQVGNTFGEQKLYLVPTEPGGGFHLRCPKMFYVSPFSEPDWEFDFRFEVPGESLRLRVDDYIGEKKALISALTGTRLPLCASNLLQLTARMPFVTLQVIYFIHWHAFRLWLKRIPWFAKQHRQEAQKDVLNPLK